MFAIRILLVLKKIRILLQLVLFFFFFFFFFRKEFFSIIKGLHTFCDSQIFSKHTHKKKKKKRKKSSGFLLFDN